MKTDDRQAGGMRLPYRSMQEHIDRYLATDGEDGHLLYDSIPCLLLNAPGRHSGRWRRVALVYGRWNESYCVVASRGGASLPPAWYHNALAAREVVVQVGAERFTALPREVEGEYDRLWEQMLALFPGYRDYRHRAGRALPILLLEPASARNGTLPPLESGEKLPAATVTLAVHHIVQGAAASRDWQPLHHDVDWVRDRAGLPDVILNTPSQAGWIARFLAARLGPSSRLGALRLRMRRPIMPGSRLGFHGLVTDVSKAEQGFWWVELQLEVRCGGEVMTLARARMALPGRCSPWQVGTWQPSGVASPERFG